MEPSEERSTPVLLFYGNLTREETVLLAGLSQNCTQGYRWIVSVYAHMLLSTFCVEGGTAFNASLLPVSGLSLVATSYAHCSESEA